VADGSPNVTFHGRQSENCAPQGWRASKRRRRTSATPELLSGHRPELLPDEGASSPEGLTKQKVPYQWSLATHRVAPEVGRKCPPHPLPTRKTG